MENFLLKKIVRPLLSFVIRLRWLFVSCLFVLAILYFRLLAYQSKYWEEAKYYITMENYKEAIYSLDKVLTSHLPFSTIEKEAIETLMELGKRFEEADIALSLLCYETVRSSRYQCAHFLTPDFRIIGQASDRIALIKAKMMILEGLEANLEEVYNKHLFLLNFDVRPNNFLAFLSTCICACYLISFYLWIKREVTWILLFSIVCYSAWLFILRGI